MASKNELLLLKAKARIELLRRGAEKGKFWDYCLYMDFDFFSRRGVLKQVADVLQHVYDAYKVGNPIHVGISMPPRSGKSYIVSLFCSFMIGHFPQKSIMRNTCTKDLYNKLSKDTRDLVDSAKWMSIFPYKLATRGVNTWGLKEATQESYFGGGTGGNIIGFGASMLDITDDLYKNWTEAMSENVNNKTIAWSDAARGSRVERGCCHIDVGTRWRKNDIIGRSVERGDYDYDVCIAAMTEDGKSFCEDVQTTEFYQKQKKNIAAEIWESEYQQNPIDVKGRLFAPDELLYYKELPNIADIEANLAVCDTADTGTDNLSMPFCVKVGDLYYIYDWLFTTAPMDVTAPLIKGGIQVNGAEKVRFESNNGGKLFAKGIAKSVNADITWKTTTSHKETRILMDAAWIKKHFVFKEDRGHGDYSHAFEQLITYVKMIKRQPDDAPDSLSMLMRFIGELGLNNVKSKSDLTRGEWESTNVEPWNIH
ncbi:MAG: terminase large subunit [Bacteroides sp.]|nr:terminase large subunit [Bacteroides sp.]